jgi:hypothetical protein
LKKLGTAIERVLRSNNLWYGYQQYLLVESWSEVVGPGLAEVTRAESISRGVLRVAVKDSVWAYHLGMLKPQLIKKMNEQAGEKTVKDIFFMIEDPDRRNTEKDI